MYDWTWIRENGNEIILKDVIRELKNLGKKEKSWIHAKLNATVILIFVVLFILESVSLVPEIQEDDDDVTDEMKFVDTVKIACLLCKRQFPSNDVLTKHLQMSQLHKVIICVISLCKVGIIVALWRISEPVQFLLEKKNGEQLPWSLLTAVKNELTQKILGSAPKRLRNVQDYFVQIDGQSLLVGSVKI